MAQPESRLQSRCRMFLGSHLLPPVEWSSVGRERKQAAWQGQQQNARGFKRGLPDIMIWGRSYFLGIELKSANGRMRPDQCAFQAKMAVLGHGYEVVRSVEQLGEKLCQHGIPLAAGWRIKAQIHDAALDTPPKAPKARTSTPRTRGNRKQVARWVTVSLAMARGPQE